jgi:hypothetical protein
MKRGENAAAHELFALADTTDANKIATATTGVDTTMQDGAENEGAAASYA